MLALNAAESLAKVVQRPENGIRHGTTLAGRGAAPFMREPPGLAS